MDFLSPIFTEKAECQDCYKCLRDYYNQEWHRVLNRSAAAEFLKQYL